MKPKEGGQERDDVRPMGAWFLPLVPRLPNSGLAFGYRFKG